MGMQPYDQYFMDKDKIRFHVSRNPTGRILWQDSFEDQSYAHWASAAQYGGSGGTSQLSSSGFNSYQCYKLSSGVASGGGYELFRRIGRIPLPSMRLGLEFMWFINNNAVQATAQHRLIFGIELCGGPSDGHKDMAVLCIDDKGDIYYNAYLSSMQGGTLLGHLDYVAGIQPHYWNYAKIVVDMRGGIGKSKFAYLLMNDLKFDMSSILADYTSVAGTDPFNNIEALFIAANLTGITTDQMYRLDDVILTCEEP
jgi:hypothetical protein